MLSNLLVSQEIVYFNPSCRAYDLILLQLTLRKIKSHSTSQPINWLTDIILSAMEKQSINIVTAADRKKTST